MGARYKVRKDGEPDRRGAGFYFRNVTEVLLFGVRGKNARTLQPGRSMANIIVSRKGAHSVKPEEQFDVIESCSPGPYMELFARRPRMGWHQWGNEHQSLPDFVFSHESMPKPIEQLRFPTRIIQ